MYFKAKKWVWKLNLKNCTINLNISPEKAITCETLTIDSKFLDILQTKIVAKEENISISCDVSKTKMLVWFSTYDEKEIPQVASL